MANETIHISKESMDTFSHDKNVVDMTMQELYKRHLECPINNGSDLNSDAMLDDLFDYGQYVENRVNGKYVVLGFIDGVPVRCEYNLGLNIMTFHALLSKKECSYSSLHNTLPERLSDEQVFSKMTYCGSGVWIAHFFYYSAD